MGKLFWQIVWFTKSVVTDVTAYLTGGMVAAGIFVWEHVTGKGISMSALIAFICVFVIVGCFTAWRQEREERERIQEAARPRIKLSFGTLIPGCVLPDTVISTVNQITFNVISQRKATYYRIKVEADSIGVIKECVGRLVSIRRNGEVVFSTDNLVLPFAPAERPNSDVQDLTDKIPEYLDFLAIGENNTVKVVTKNWAKPSNVDWENLFSSSATYEFHIIVGARGTQCKSVEIMVTMKWDGKLSTVEIDSH